MGDLRGVAIRLTGGELDEGVGHLGVEAQPPRGRELGVHRLAHQGVGKGEPRSFLGDELAVERLVEGVEQLLLAEVGDPTDDVGPKHASDHGADGQYFVGGGRQAAELPTDELSDTLGNIQTGHVDAWRRGPTVLVQHPGRPQMPQCLDDEVGIASRRFRHGLGDGLNGALAHGISAE